MIDGYDLDCTKDGGDHLSDLDEYLTEYVDGTMDPATREAFEEYLEANPELVEHVCCLNDVRCALEQLTSSCRAPAGVQSRVRQLISCEMLDGEGTPQAKEAQQYYTLAVAAATVVLVSMGAVMMYGQGAGEMVSAPTVESVEESIEGESSDRRAASWAVADRTLRRSTPYKSPWLLDTPPGQSRSATRTGRSSTALDGSFEAGRSFGGGFQSSSSQQRFNAPLLHQAGARGGQGFTFSPE
jgi:hypothetical protein